MGYDVLNFSKGFAVVYKIYVLCDLFLRGLCFDFWLVAEMFPQSVLSTTRKKNH